ncbi:MAG: hypothetical protein LBJ71_00575, partial [Holosporaceae bacterium]|nr:hypothetical protein [Holosporaceae bacterium]
MVTVNFKKITTLFIFIVASVVSTFAAVLDLPANIPGRQEIEDPFREMQPDTVYKQVNGQGTFCEHVIVPNTNPEAHVYFPINGVQPTTPEAVEYSCANVDNREDSPITEWYMQMFGVIPINHAAIAAAVGDNAHAPVFVQAGWTNPAAQNPLAAQTIITFDATCNVASHNNCSAVDAIPEHYVDNPSISGAQIGRRDLFEREFRKIASTSVGRVLLYRILIEIRRHIGHNARGEGILEENINNFYHNLPNWLTTGLPTLLEQRNRLRSLRIKYAYETRRGEKISWCFDRNDQSLTFDCKIPEVQSICDSTNGFDYIIAHKASFDISLFHEMLHWFHFLRNPHSYKWSRVNKTTLFASFMGYYCWR